jgi:nicotinate-nucleotide--dimethylbenzimidazole phosphoribosyltransferase
LGMRLGEGTGAALAAGIVKTAAAVHRDMATFGQAGVSERLS